MQDGGRGVEYAYNALCRRGANGGDVQPEGTASSPLERNAIPSAAEKTPTGDNRRKSMAKKKASPTPVLSKSRSSNRPDVLVTARSTSLTRRSVIGRSSKRRELLNGGTRSSESARRLSRAPTEKYGCTVDFVGITPRVKLQRLLLFLKYSVQ